MQLSFVFFTQLIHAEDCDNVLKGLVALQDFLHLTGYLVMLFTDDARIDQTIVGKPGGLPADQRT